MKVYWLGADGDHFDDIERDTGEDVDVSEFAYPGHPMSIAATWRPIGVVIKKRRGAPRTDIYDLIGNMPVFSMRAVNALKDVLVPRGELLPMNCKDEDLFFFNVLHEVAALDLQRCTFLIGGDGVPIYIKKYVFLPDVVTNEWIFKDTQEEESHVFVTDRFRERVEAAGLVGFDFRLFWDSEAPPEPPHEPPPPDETPITFHFDPVTVLTLVPLVAHFGSIAAKDSQGADLLARTPNGPEPLAAKWRPTEVLISRAPGQPLSDFYYAGGDMGIFSRRAVDALQDILLPRGELLPLKCADAELYYFNALHEAPALDYENAKYVRDEEGTVLYISRLAFHPEIIANEYLFRDCRFGPSEIFVTDRFVNRVNEAGLVGFGFSWQWSLNPPA